MINEINSHPLSLPDLIKERRAALGLTQEQVANALRVVPEAVGYWERRKRRIDLDRVLPLAAILQLDQQDVCRLALFEHYPRVHAALFGTERPPQPRHLEQ
jgi:transcriptional regulator with XRE-family HTH domain